MVHKIANSQKQHPKIKRFLASLKWTIKATVWVFLALAAITLVQQAVMVAGPGTQVGDVVRLTVALLLLPVVGWLVWRAFR